MAKFSKKGVQKITATHIHLNWWKEVFYGVIISAKCTYLGVLGTHRDKKLEKRVMDVKMGLLLRHGLGSSDCILKLLV